MRKIAILAGFLILAGAARAQTISPVIVEYTEKASGKFQVANDSDFPLVVVLEPKSFSVDEAGNPAYRPLDQAIHIELSAKSFRLAPHETFTVFYKASADHVPAWFTIYATVTGRKTADGLELAIHLPHTVYLLTKHALADDAVVWEKAEFDAGTKKIEATVYNRGAEYGRVKTVVVSGPSGKKQYPGFPLFPAQHRAVELDWDQSGGPDRIEAQFQHFKSESPVHAATGSK